MKPKLDLSHAAWIAAGAVSISLCLLASPALAASGGNAAADTGIVARQLNGTPRAEIPTKVASMVVQAQGSDRSQQAEAIIKSAVDLHPTAAATIVGASAKWSPDLAPLMAASASSHQPKQLASIARAAATAAPSQAEAIVETLCKQDPARYREIAVAVSQSVTGMDRLILAAVSRAVPNLKLFLSRATDSLSGLKGYEQTVSVVLTQVDQDLKNSAPALKTTVPILVRDGVAPTQYAMLPAPPRPAAPPVITNPRVRAAFTPREDDGDDEHHPMTRDDTEVKDPAGPRNYSKP
jgi:hypothetical protein